MPLLRALMVWALSGGALAAGPAAPPAQGQLNLMCEAVYLPAREIWVRHVTIGYDDQRVRTVLIDGVPVHSFAIAGTVILTALDNERIQIDTAAQTWTSDFRGVASAQGRCERSR